MRTEVEEHRRDRGRLRRPHLRAQRGLGNSASERSVVARPARCAAPGTCIARRPAEEPARHRPREARCDRFRFRSLVATPFVLAEIVRMLLATANHGFLSLAVRRRGEAVLRPFATTRSSERSLPQRRSPRASSRSS